MQVDGFSTFFGCQWIEQDEEHVTVEYRETGGPVRAQLRLVDVRAVYAAAPIGAAEASTSGAVDAATCRP